MTLDEIRRARRAVKANQTKEGIADGLKQDIEQAIATLNVLWSYERLDAYLVYLREQNNGRRVLRREAAKSSK